MFILSNFNSFNIKKTWKKYLIVGIFIKIIITLNLSSFCETLWVLQKLLNHKFVSYHYLYLYTLKSYPFTDLIVYLKLFKLHKYT